MKAIYLALTLFFLSQQALGDFTVDGTFAGCDYGKVYLLTNGRFLLCESYGYQYAYRPDVYQLSSGRVLVDGEEYRGRIVDGSVISTNIDGEWEGCNFDSHRLANGMILYCNSYFYEYAYMPSVEVILINGEVSQISINGEVKDGVSVGR